MIDTILYPILYVGGLLLIIAVWVVLIPIAMAAYLSKSIVSYIIVLIKAIYIYTDQSDDQWE